MPGFPEKVDDVVIEFANSRYQEVLDDYLLKLEEVPRDRLKQVWRNTSQTTGVWDSPVYEAFLRALREVNEELLPMNRIRAVAGDPPIDWSRVEVFEDRLPFMQRGWSCVR